MPRHACPSTNRVAPAGYAAVNFRDWKASITDFGKSQKKPSEHSLQERQSSTSSIPYGECIATLPVGAPNCARASRSGWKEINFALTGRLPPACALSRELTGFKRYKSGQKCSPSRLFKSRPGVRDKMGEGSGAGTVAPDTALARTAAIGK